jgi:uncharacterized membrane protein
VESRELARVTAFTDAAVAIALTLLVLPLVTVAHEAGDTPLATLVNQHSGDLAAMLLSFFAVALFWRAHRRMFERLERVDEMLLVLNVLWLLGVVFLPVPTAVLTLESTDGFGAALLYLTNLLYISLLGLALNGWIHLRPELRRPGVGSALWGGLIRSAVSISMIVIVMVAAARVGSIVVLLLLAVPLLHLMVHRLDRSESEPVDQ